MVDSDLLVDTSTFARELEDLAQSHRAVWLAAVLPSGPTLVWSGGRALSATLSADPRRPVVLIEPSEADAAAAMGRGAPGLRVVHAPGGSRALPDLPALGLAQFAALVILARDEDELRHLVPSLLTLGMDGCALCIVAGVDLEPAIREVVGALAGPIVVHRQRVVAASQIDHPGAGSFRDEVRQLGVSSEPQAVLVTVGLDSAGSSVLLGHDLAASIGGAASAQVVSSAAALDEAADRLHQARVHELEIAVERARVANERARSTIENLTQQIELLHASHSWRATAPLRRITGLLRPR